MGAAAIGRRVGVLIVLSGLLAVVAVASRLPLSSHADGSGAAGDLRVTLSVLVVLVAVAAVVLLVLLASLFRGARRRRSPDEVLVARQPPIPAWKALPFLPLVVAVTLAAFVVVEALGGAQIHPQSIVRPATARRTAAAPAAALGRAGGSGLELSTGVVVAGAALIVLLCATAAGVVLRDRASRRSTVSARDGTLETEIDEAIADLVSGSSARRAVIGAYVRMERALAGRALAHRASEAPREYLARTRAALGAAGESAGRLTELFEEARFSPHEIGEPMRQEAIDALAALRAELGGER